MECSNATMEDAFTRIWHVTETHLIAMITVTNLSVVVFCLTIRLHNLITIIMLYVYLPPLPIIKENFII